VADVHRWQLVGSFLESLSGRARHQFW
jgi:hypothetical protein